MRILKKHPRLYMCFAVDKTFHSQIRVPPGGDSPHTWMAAHSLLHMQQPSTSQVVKSQYLYESIIMLESVQGN